MDEEWIRPDRPLSGDKGQTHLYPKLEVDVPQEEDEQEEDELDEDVEKWNDVDFDQDDDGNIEGLDDDELAKLEAALTVFNDTDPITATVIPRPEESTDWLATRRAKQRGLEMVKPGQGKLIRQQATDLPVLEGILLTSQEIERCMLSLGGLNINLILESKNKSMGGAKGMIFITGNTTNHLKLMSDTLVRQLKLRNLAKHNVNGAMFGSEGGDDGEDDWRIVDCSNYIVHLQLAETRKRYNLEFLWSGKDALDRLSLTDEDAVEKYIYENPVPPEIHRGKRNKEAADISQTMAYLSKGRFNLPHRSVVDRPARKRGNRKPKGRKYKK